MNWFQLIAMAQPDIAAKYPLTRRFFAQGFVIDPRHHADNLLGLTSVHQTIRLDLITGNFEPVQESRPATS